MQYKIVVDKQSRTSPSAEKKEYIVDVEELRYKGDVFDSLVISANESYVLRQFSLSEYHVLKKLENPIKETLEDLNIELFEGDNYIYLVDMEGNNFFAEYIIKNDFTDSYPTKIEMTSAINQSAQNIELSVNQKLTEFTTTSEVNSAITISANDILSAVSSTYTTKTDTTSQINTAKTEIKQTTDSISLEVLKKVGNTEIISKINQSAEEIKILAKKIGLTASDIIDIISGNSINLTSKNVTINSTNFNVDANGKMSCNSGNVGGWIINNSGLTNGVVKLNNDGSSTIFTVADLIIIRGYIMGTTGFSLPQKMIEHYDLNNDGIVNSQDYVILQNLIGISMN